MLAALSWGIGGEMQGAAKESSRGERQGSLSCGVLIQQVPCDMIHNFCCVIRFTFSRFTIVFFCGVHDSQLSILFACCKQCSWPDVNCLLCDPIKLQNLV